MFAAMDLHVAAVSTREDDRDAADTRSVSNRSDGVVVYDLRNRVVFDDYMDWTLAKRETMCQTLVDQLKQQEQAARQSVQTIDEAKDAVVNDLVLLLRDIFFRRRELYSLLENVTQRENLLRQELEQLANVAARVKARISRNHGERASDLACYLDRQRVFGWKRVWVELSRTSLRVFHSEDDETADVNIKLTQIESCEAFLRTSSLFHNKTGVFQVVANGSEHRFAAGSADRAAVWVKTITKLQAALRAGTQPTASSGSVTEMNVIADSIVSPPMEDLPSPQPHQPYHPQHPSQVFSALDAPFVAADGRGDPLEADLARAREHRAACMAQLEQTLKDRERIAGWCQSLEVAVASAVELITAWCPGVLHRLSGSGSTDQLSPMATTGPDTSVVTTTTTGADHSRIEVESIGIDEKYEEESAASVAAESLSTDFEDVDSPALIPSPKPLSAVISGAGKGLRRAVAMPESGSNTWPTQHPASMAGGLPFSRSLEAPSSLTAPSPPVLQAVRSSSPRPSRLPTSSSSRRNTLSGGAPSAQSQPLGVTVPGSPAIYTEYKPALPPLHCVVTGPDAAICISSSVVMPQMITRRIAGTPGSPMLRRAQDTSNDPLPPVSADALSLFGLSGAVTSKKHKSSNKPKSAKLSGAMAVSFKQFCSFAETISNLRPKLGGVAGHAQALLILFNLFHHYRFQNEESLKELERIVVEREDALARLADIRMHLGLLPEPSFSVLRTDESELFDVDLH